MHIVSERILIDFAWNLGNMASKIYQKFKKNYYFKEIISENDVVYSV